MKYILIIIIILVIIGCDKEKVEPPQPDCNCEVVILTGGARTPNGVRTSWWYDIRNNCTNAVLKMRVSSPYPSDEYCRDSQW